MFLHHDALVLQDCPACVCRLRAVLQPSQCLLEVDVDCCRVSERIVYSDLLNESAITWRPAICYHHVVVGLLLAALPS